MAVVLVTYDLKAPGRNYQPVHDYLKTFSYCKGLESVWLLDTELQTTAIRDALMAKVDTNDVIFVTPILRAWAAKGFGCAEWLNDPKRRW